jgi:hypothetical protein
MNLQKPSQCENGSKLCLLFTISYALAIILCFIGCSVCAGGTSGEKEPAGLHPSDSEDRICLSLRVLAIEAEKNPLRKEVETLAGIGWLEGFVVDPENQDVILIGRSSPKWPALHLDDLAVNIRNVWYGKPHPYCSLDPRPKDVIAVNQLASRARVVTSVDQMREFFKQLEEVWGPQSVVVGGVPRNSRHAHVMINADYHMKKLSQGLVELPGTRSLLGILLKDAETKIEKTGQIPALGMSMSRFWFHVGEGEPTYQESKGILCLDECSVVVLTEKQRAAVDGTLYDSGGDDPYAKTFAQELSDGFRQAATLVPEYADLENLFRLSALLHAMHFHKTADQAKLNLGFYLKDYDYQTETTMPLSLPGLANSEEAQGQVRLGGLLYQYVLFPMAFGGVSMEIAVDQKQFARTRTKQMNQLREAAVAARPSRDALFWHITGSSKQ